MVDFFIFFIFLRLTFRVHRYYGFGGQIDSYMFSYLKI